jgi:hypothetical protein
MESTFDPTLTIERKDVNGDYEPSNCVWDDKIAQANNTRKNRFIFVDGQRMTIAQAARANGLKEGLLRSRLDKQGLSVDEALNLPLQKGGYRGDKFYSIICKAKPHKNRKYCQYKGVSWRKENERWYAQICKNGKNIYLGSFSTPEEAALTYNAAALRLFGGNAYTNPIPSK